MALLSLPAPKGPAYLEKPEIAAPGWTFLAESHAAVDFARILREAEEAKLSVFELSAEGASQGGGIVRQTALIVRRGTPEFKVLSAKVMLYAIAEIRFSGVGALEQRNGEFGSTWFAVSSVYIGRAKEALKELALRKKVRVSVVPL